MTSLLIKISDSGYDCSNLVWKLLLPWLFCFQKLFWFSCFGDQTNRQVSIDEGDAKSREFGVMFIESSAKAGFNIKVKRFKFRVCKFGVNLLEKRRFNRKFSFFFSNCTKHNELNYISITPFCITFGFFF